MSVPKHRRLAGPDTKPERPAMAEALASLDARRGPPSPDDRPPVSTFPMTPAARAALQLSRGK